MNIVPLLFRMFVFLGFNDLLPKKQMLKYSEVQILAGCAVTTVRVYSRSLDDTGWIWCAFVVYDRYSEP